VWKRKEEENIGRDQEMWTAGLKYTWRQKYKTGLDGDKCSLDNRPLVSIQD